MEGMEVVKSKREIDGVDNKSKENSVSKNEVINNSSANKLVNTVCDNFDSIMNLASSIVEIKAMKVQSEAVLAKMREDRQMLLAEAETYCMKKNADTNDVVAKMNIIRLMMQDFYAQSNQNISGEDFRSIISEIVTQMGKVSDGN